MPQKKRMRCWCSSRRARWILCYFSPIAAKFTPRRHTRSRTLTVPGGNPGGERARPRCRRSDHCSGARAGLSGRRILHDGHPQRTDRRVALAEFAAVRPSGLIAITLDHGDELGWVRLTHGDSEVILVTERGQALRFVEDEVRSMGRTAAGVNGIRLDDGDHVASMEVIESGADLFIVTTRGYGKRTSLNEYPVKSRAHAVCSPSIKMP